MITFKDIKDAITLKLSTEFPEIKVYDEQVKQGFDAHAFFIQLIPINNTRANFFTENPTLMIDIQYFPQEESNDELYDINEKLGKSFKPFFIQVKDRVLNIIKVEYEIFDFVLHFQLNLDYLVSIREEVEGTENKELMQEINFKI